MVIKQPPARYDLLRKTGTLTRTVDPSAAFKIESWILLKTGLGDSSLKCNSQVYLWDFILR